jgi:hypothetical protein
MFPLTLSLSLERRRNQRILPPALFLFKRKPLAGRGEIRSKREVLEMVLDIVPINMDFGCRGVGAA